MRLILFAALAASLFAQDKKESPKKDEKPTERALTEAETLKFKLAATSVMLQRKEFKADDFEAAVKPFNDEENALIVAACLSVGVDQAGIQKGECGFTAGIGPDLKPQLGADGKPVQPKVWKNIPPPAVEKK